MNLKTEISQLKNMVEKLDDHEKNSQVLSRALSVIDEIIDRLDGMNHHQSEILEYVEALDEDLSVLENQLVQSAIDEDDDNLEIGGINEKK